MLVGGPVDQDLAQSKGQNCPYQQAAADTDQNRLEDDAEDVSPGCAEGHADAEFAGALDDRVGHDTVEPNGGHDEGQGGECAEEPGKQLAARLFRLVLNPVFQVFDVGLDLLVVVDGVDFCADWVEQAQR